MSLKWLLKKRKFDVPGNDHKLFVRGTAILNRYLAG